jgi:hypothetical protein
MPGGVIGMDGEVQAGGSNLTLRRFTSMLIEQDQTERTHRIRILWRLTTNSRLGNSCHSLNNYREGYCAFRVTIYIARVSVILSFGSPS